MQSYGEKVMAKRRSGRIVITHKGFSLCKAIDDGIKDEKKGLKYWSNLGRALDSIDSPEANSAHRAAYDEGKHENLLRGLEKRYCG